MYYNEGDEYNYEKYLACSAIADIKNCNRDIASLEELSNMLYLQGDIDRGYVYISHCLKAALLYPNRVRVINISAVMDKLQHAYSQRKANCVSRSALSASCPSFCSYPYCSSAFNSGNCRVPAKNWMKRTGFLTCTLENFPMPTGCWRM